MAKYPESLSSLFQKTSAETSLQTLANNVEEIFKKLPYSGQQERTRKNLTSQLLKKLRLLITEKGISTVGELRTILASDITTFSYLNLVGEIKIEGMRELFNIPTVYKESFNTVDDFVLFIKKQRKILNIPLECYMPLI